MGPAILCIHGIASSRKAWERFGRRFAGRFTTYAYDQRGHGDAATTAPGPMTHARSVADARAVAATIGIPLAAIVGHSWGGAIAILAGREIDGARAIVAVDPMIHVKPYTFQEDYLNDVAADLVLDERERERVLRERLEGWDELDIAGKIHAMRSMESRSIAELGSANHVDQGGWNLRERVVGYPKPLLIAAAGPEDSVMSDGDVAVVKTAGPKVRLVEFSDQGHNLHRTDFARFTAEFERFLDSVG